MAARKAKIRSFKSYRDWCRQAGVGRVDKLQPDGEFLRDSRVGELIDEAMARPEVRDAVVKHATFSDSWEDALPVIFSKDKSQEVVVVDPDDYIGMATGSRPYPEGSLVLVSGDVQVPSWREDLGRELKFRKAVIKGCLEIFNCDNLKEVDCVVTGWLSLTNCRGLDNLRGEIFGGVSLNNSDLRNLGADFRCGGNLVVFDCPELKTLNCEASGGVSVVNSGLERTGAAFHSRAGVRIVNCPALRKMEGVVEEGVDIEIRGKGGVVNCQGLSVKGRIKAKGVSIERVAPREDKGLIRGSKIVVKSGRGGLAIG